MSILLRIAVLCHTCGSLFSGGNPNCEEFDASDSSQQDFCKQGEACLWYSWQKSDTETSVIRECFSPSILVFWNFFFWHQFLYQYSFCYIWISLSKFLSCDFTTKIIHSQKFGINRKHFMNSLHCNVPLLYYERKIKLLKSLQKNKAEK